MSYLDDIWDKENKEMEERMKRNAKYFESLSDKEKLELLWKEYVERHYRD